MELAPFRMSDDGPAAADIDSITAAIRPVNAPGARSETSWAPI
jgi:hypothetical protein